MSGSQKNGFSLIELVMALIVLAFGVLGLATTTLLVTRQLTMASIATGRAAAIQSVIERIRATPFDSLGSGGDTIGPTVLSWSPTDSTAQSKALQIVSVGPGMTSVSPGRPTPMLSDVVADTLMYVVLRP